MTGTSKWYELQETVHHTPMDGFLLQHMKQRPSGNQFTCTYGGFYGYA